MTTDAKLTTRLNNTRKGREGLPAWSYTNKELFDLECDTLFRCHWQIIGHVNDIPYTGDYLTLDIVGERALVVRDRKGEIHAFHNLCRHRASRVVAGEQGNCAGGIITCPFHAWTYELDGRLRAAAHASSFPPLDKDDWGLKPIEFEIWHGLIFVRFNKGPQPSVKEMFAPFEDEVKPYLMDDMVPDEKGIYQTEAIPINWKSARDVDNEGYHVAMAHPGLHDLYGQDYVDEVGEGDVSRSIGVFNKTPARLWSVKHYRECVEKLEAPWSDLPKSWLYLGLYPNNVVAFYPDSVIFYQDIPKGVLGSTVRGATYRRRDESRQLKAARYLSGRIDNTTIEEDLMLMVWSQEAVYSSGYDGIILSDLERGVRAYHDRLRQDLPILNDDDKPEAGQLRSRNDDLLKGKPNGRS